MSNTSPAQNKKIVLEAFESASVSGRQAALELMTEFLERQDATGVMA